MHFDPHTFKIVYFTLTMNFISWDVPHLNYLDLLRRSGRAVYLYSTAHKTQLTIMQLKDFLHTSLFPDLLPQPIGGFINNIFRELNATT